MRNLTILILAIIVIVLAAISLNTYFSNSHKMAVDPALYEKLTQIQKYNDETQHAISLIQQNKLDEAALSQPS